VTNQWPITFGLLGPLLVTRDDDEVPIRPGKQRILLAALLLQAGRLVTAETLIDALWGDGAPATARNTLQVHVKRLREALGPGLLVTDGSGGYRIDVPPECIDCERWALLLDSARLDRAAENLPAEWDRLSAALALWRGSALADINSPALARDYATALEEQRLSTMERRFDVGLALERHEELASDLAAATAANPLREHLWCQRLLALCRSGRQADALTEYQAVETRLVNELGVDPGPELRGVREVILAGGTALRAPPMPVTIPAQLPRDPTAFTGRRDEVDTLDRLLRDSPVVVVTGVAGAGKTALAIHWALRRLDLFEDGQLYVDLRGYDDEQGPASPEHVLDAFLRALGVPAERMPDDPTERASLYRSMTQNRRMIIVLDNARSSAQVRRLIPGSAGICVLITSRDRLDGLIARDGARRLALDVLDHSAAVDLLLQLVPADRVESTGAVERLATCCDRLPLALRIAAARIMTNPYQSAGTLADALADLGDRLGVLSLESADTSVRATFSLSYKALPDKPARLLRLIGSHSSADMSAGCAAALADTSRAETNSYLEVLCRAHLLYHSGADRYGMHDLVRAYARERCAAEDSVAARSECARRGVDWLLQGAADAGLMLAPSGLGRPPELHYPPRTPSTFDSVDAALLWLKNEWEEVLAAAGMCADNGWHRACWQLAAKIAPFLQSQAHVSELEALCLTGLRSARTIGDALGECTMLSFAGNCARDQREYKTAIERFTQARDLANRLGDLAMSSRIGGALGAVYVLDGQPEPAEHVLRQGIATARANDDLVMATYHKLVLANLLLRRDSPRAKAMLQELLEATAELDDQYATTMAHGQLAQLALSEGTIEEAANQARTTIRLAQSIGEVIEEADALVVLGECYLDTDPVQALSCWGLALDIYQRTGHPQAVELRKRIAAATAAAS
jgi:DNA-binding SARP family transcriptional activator/tetratricopeptide (TPR) repeat protein